MDKTPFTRISGGTIVGFFETPKKVAEPKPVEVAAPPIDEEKKAQPAPKKTAPKKTTKKK